MDKEILRIVIIGTGLLVIIGMVLWSFAKSGRLKRDFDFFDGKNAVDHIDPSLALHPEHDDFDIESLDGNMDDEYDDDYYESKLSGSNTSTAVSDSPKVKAASMPALIQFSLMANNDEGFNGIDLINAFDNVGLEYGSLKIFERVDMNRLVDFGVASMVEPGTFPETGLEDFYSPGIVFFMQPCEVDDPLAVFDDFIQTINLLAQELDGEKLDQQHQPLNQETIAMLRERLQ